MCLLPLLFYTINNFRLMFPQQLFIYFYYYYYFINISLLSHPSLPTHHPLCKGRSCMPATYTTQHNIPPSLVNVDDTSLPL